MIAPDDFHPPTPGCSEWIRESLDGTNGRLTALKGPNASGMLHEIASWSLLDPGPTLFICGDNRLDSSTLLQKARENGMHPALLLARLHLSRTFTIHQFSAAIIRNLEKALALFGSRVVLVSGIIPLFCDNAVPEQESLRILEESLLHLKSLSRRGTLIFLSIEAPGSHPDKRFQKLLPRIMGRADRIWEQAAPQDVWVLRPTRGSGPNPEETKQPLSQYPIGK
ncbi:MAG: hypothetical protein ACYCYP_05825 [Leptospirales bacterium]